MIGGDVEVLNRFGRWLKNILTGVDTIVCPRGRVDEGKVRECIRVSGLPVKCLCSTEDFQDNIAKRRERMSKVKGCRV